MSTAGFFIIVRGKILYSFSKNVGVRDSNEAEVLAISEARSIHKGSFPERLLVESDSSNAISCMTNSSSESWRVEFIFNEIKVLISQNRMDLLSCV